MKQFIFPLFAVCLSIVFIIVGCSKDETKPFQTDCNESITYTNGAKAVFDANCATSGCHDVSTMADGKGYYDFSNAMQFSQDANFECSITQSGGCTPMPLGGSKISDEDINTLLCWISNGMPE